MNKGVVVKTSVFAATPVGGNPCPVVLEADGFSGEEMQETAFRFGVETVFVLRPDRRGPTCDCVISCRGMKWRCAFTPQLRP